MIRVLLLTRYGRLGASSRMRSLQYIPYLLAAGANLVTFPLFSDVYVRELQQGRRSPLEVVRAYVLRLLRMLRAESWDVLWIEKEVFPWLPAWFERALLSGRNPYVLDYDDAVFHYYDQHRSGVVRWALRNKHRNLMRSAALVVAGNDYLANYAIDAGAARVEILPTVVDLQRYSTPARAPIKGGFDVPCVGWIGQRSTADFLIPLVPLFERLREQGEARFTAIGVDSLRLGLPMASVPWCEESEVDALRTLDIGIMPLVDGPFERGKCGYKLIQYMACGLPVVASPVGVNSQIVEHGVNGFLAETNAQWDEALRTLLADASLRKRMGDAGRRLVEEKYCLQATAPRMAELLISACRR